LGRRESGRASGSESFIGKPLDWCIYNGCKLLLTADSSKDISVINEGA